MWIDRLLFIFFIIVRVNIIVKTYGVWVEYCNSVFREFWFVFILKVDCGMEVMLGWF